MEMEDLWPDDIELETPYTKAVKKRSLALRETVSISLDCIHVLGYQFTIDAGYILEN